MLDEIARKVGFQYEIHIVADAMYGTKQPDGTWNGMVGGTDRKGRLLYIVYRL